MNTRSRKLPATYMRKVLGANLIALLSRDYAKLGPITNQQLALGKATGMSLSSIQRLCDGSSGATIDTIEALATSFGLSVYQLLLPNLDVRTPQTVAGADKAEQAYFNQAKRLRLTTRHKITEPA